MAQVRSFYRTASARVGVPSAVIDQMFMIGASPADILE